MSHRTLVALTMTLGLALTAGAADTGSADLRDRAVDRVAALEQQVASLLEAVQPAPEARRTQTHGQVDQLRHQLAALQRHIRRLDSALHSDERVQAIGIDVLAGRVSAIDGRLAALDSRVRGLTRQAESQRGVAGMITGTVTESAGGTPVETYLYLYTTSGNYLGYALSNAATGDYSFAGLGTGNYAIITNNYYGYVDEIWNDIYCPAGSCSVSSGNAIPVTDGVTTSGIDFVLDPGGLIAGTVTDGSTGLYNVEVDVFEKATGDYRGYGFTDGSGDYTLYSGLPTGTYVARTYNSDGYINELYDDILCIGYCDPTPGTPIAVTLGATTSGIDFALDVGATITGTVTAVPGGAPIQGVSVNFYDAGNNYLTYGYTNSSGRYSAYAGLPPGSYYAITGNSAGYINEIYDDLPAAGHQPNEGTPIPVTTGINPGIDFALEPGGTISGTVTDDATAGPLQGIRVYVYDDAGTYMTSRTTDASGNYTTTLGLTTGTYFARTTNSLGYANELYDNLPCSPTCTVTGGTAISVTAGADTPGIDFGLSSGGRISGTVTDQTSGNPIAGIRVYVYTDTGSYVTNVTTDSLGDYITTVGLDTGTYYLRTVNDLSYFDEIYDDIPCTPSSCNVTTGTPVSVTSGTTTSGINFALVIGGSISGTVTKASGGTPTSWGEVDIYNSTGSFVTWGSLQGDGSYTSRTGLATGTYYATTYTTEGLLDELYDDIPCPAYSCNVTTGTAISVTAGFDTSGIDFELLDGGRLAGSVTNESTGVGIQWVYVEVYSDTGSWSSYGYSDGLGSYITLFGMPDGTYHARSSDYAGIYLDEVYWNQPCFDGCDISNGTPISATEGSTTWGVDFAVTPTAAIILYAGFENGDFSEWSATGP